jgi:hypothetical protein
VELPHPDRLLEIAPALTCGNTMVFKPSETTPLSALKIAEIYIEAGLPPGVFNVIQGFGDVGAALVADARVAKVSLTGSAPTGRKVYQAAAAGMKHATMELGGKSPLIIFDDADLWNAVSGAINANFYASGQVCSNGTRVFVQTGIKGAFLDRLCRAGGKAVIGDPRDEATNFGPMVSEEQVKIVMDYIDLGVKEGARLVYGGRRAEPARLLIEPTVFADVTDDMTIAREEIFGRSWPCSISTRRTRWSRGPTHRTRPVAGGVHPRPDPGAPGDPAARGGILLDQPVQPDAGGGALRRGEGLGRRARELARRHRGLLARSSSVYVGMGRRRGAILRGGMEADYVIVGAGSAGCAMAYRLAEAGASVLVIEHGGSDCRAVHPDAGRAVLPDEHEALRLGFRPSPSRIWAGAGWPVRAAR